MPSITQWSALGGLGKAAGQSLQELLASRFAEQKQRDLVAENEAQREQRRLEAEALAQYRRDQLAQGDRTYEQNERELASLQGVRDISARDADLKIQDTATQRREQEAAVAALSDPSFDTLPLAQRQYLYAKATGGQTPSAGMLLTPAERLRQLEEAEGPSSPKTRSAMAVEDVRERNRPPSPDPNAPPKPTDREQAIPAELSEILTGLAQHAPSLEVARQFIEQNKAKIRADFPTTDFIVVDEKLASYFKTRPAKGRTGIEAITEALSGAPPAPTYTYPGKRGTPAPAPGVTPPTPPAVADPTLEILRQRGLVQ